MSSPRTMDPKMREAEGDGEDNSGKKKSKFKSFKKFFGKKKRKETSSSVSSSLKLCQSTNDVAASRDTRTSYDSEDELETHKGIMGSRALSHDSIFILETGQEPARPVRVFSQENISDRIRALQLKLQPTMKLGPPPPFGLHAKRTEDAGTSSEDDGLPRSPPEMSLLHESLSSGMRTRFSDSHKHLSSLSLAGTGSEEEEQITLGSSRSRSTDGQLFLRHGSSKAESPRTSDSTISPTANFDTPPELSAFLDNSAAKHKLLIKPRNQRSSRMRKFSQRTQSESLTDLSCTPEEEEEDDAVFKPSNQELPCSAAATQDVAFWPKPSMPEDLPPALRPVGTQPASKPADGQETLLPENQPEDCQPALEIMCEESESSLPSEGKDSATSSYSSSDRGVQNQEDSSETLVLLSGDGSINIVNQENKELPTVFPLNKLSSEENISISKNSIVCLGRSEENKQKDDQVHVEVPCNKGTDKEFTLLSESSKECFMGSSQPADSLHVSHAASSTQMGSSTFCSLEKIKTAQEAAASEKENKEEQMGKKADKAVNELNAFKKFSVSSARERPSTRSLYFPERSELESPLNTGFFLSKAKVSSRNEKWQGDFQKGSDLDKEKSSSKKGTLLPESYSENTGQSTESLAGYISPAVDEVPMPNNSSVVSQNQSSFKDKSPFQVKLRSTSLSLKYEDNSPPESKGIKRYSAEFNLENEGLPSFLRGDKAEIRKTANTNTGDSLNEKIKPKAKSSEQLSCKPPLPKKPVWQSITIPNTTASKEKQDKAIHSPESRNEDRDLEKQSTACKVPEKSVSSPMAAGDSGKDPDTPTEPAWISIARQKQRGMHQEKELNREKLVAPDNESNTEKQNKGKEQTEGPVKQQWSKPSHLAPKTTSEEQRKDTKSETKSLLRTNSLSHCVPVAPSPALVDKEEISHLKKASNAAPNQPSWMELAKKKSQAWSGMPQIIK
ncbi:CRACD-like protein isoform X1 [Molothrus ater]|uniref:CRACD-like protein isoform X1 n=1 Tax=Molothrus ater TaxID=84834 RepID=UPI00174A5231|nr:CRACD-like protein isoform X1 [Molothrus ater]XP_054370057.1 CRACD-like protein isoform X1 [Molothrus ater]XP_054370058.1 CRACD-like protein isoform X1 [Molothrus ater]